MSPCFQELTEASSAEDVQTWLKYHSFEPFVADFVDYTGNYLAMRVPPFSHAPRPHVDGYAAAAPRSFLSTFAVEVMPIFIKSQTVHCALRCLFPQE